MSGVVRAGGGGGQHVIMNKTQTGQIYHEMNETEELGPPVCTSSELAPSNVLTQSHVFVTVFCEVSFHSDSVTLPLG